MVFGTLKMGRDNGFRFLSKEHIKEMQDMQKKYEDVNVAQPMNVNVKYSIPIDEIGNTPEQDRLKNIYDDIYEQTPSDKIYWSKNPCDWTFGFNEDEGDDDDDFEDDLLDISNEEYRRYIFDRNRDVMILFPIFLYEDPDNGEHIIVDRENVTHVIPEGWITMQVEYIYD